MLPHLADRPLNLQRLPERRRRARASGRRTSRRSSPKWLTIWHETGFREREDRAANDHLVADRAAALCWLGNQASFEIHAWTSTLRRAVDADVRPDRHRPRHEDDLGRDPRARASCTGPPSSTSASARTPSSPAAAASRPGSRSSAAATSTRDTSAWVEKLSRAIGGTVPRPRVVGVGEGRSRRQGAPRLHPERGDQDARRPVRGPPAAGRPGLRADPLGGARRPEPPPRPLDDPRRCRRASPRSATCGRARRRTTRSCRRSSRSAPVPGPTWARSAPAAGSRRRDEHGCRDNPQRRVGRRRVSTAAAASTMPRVDRAPQPPSPLARPMAQRRRPGPRGALAPPRTREPARGRPPQGGCAMRKPILLLAAVALGTAACSSSGPPRFVSGLRRGDVRPGPPPGDAAAVRPVRAGAAARDALRRRHLRGPGRQPVRPGRPRPRVHVRARRRHRVVRHRPALRRWTATSPIPASVRAEEFVNAFDQDYAAPTDGTFAISSDGGPSPFLDEREVLLRSASRRRRSPASSAPTPRSRSSSTRRARWPARTASASSSRR